MYKKIKSLIIVLKILAILVIKTKDIPNKPK